MSFFIQGENSFSKYQLTLGLSVFKLNYIFFVVPNSLLGVLACNVNALKAVKSLALIFVPQHSFSNYIP